MGHERKSVSERETMCSSQGEGDERESKPFPKPLKTLKQENSVIKSTFERTQSVYRMKDSLKREQEYPPLDQSGCCWRVPGDGW